MNLRSAAALLFALLLVPVAGGAQVPVREPTKPIPTKPRPPTVEAGKPNPNLKPFPLQNQLQNQRPSNPKLNQAKGGEEGQGAAAPGRIAPSPAPGRAAARTAAPAAEERAPARELSPEEQEARREQAREEARKQGRFQLDFDKAELADVIQTISDFTGKLFIVPENIRGKVTIVGPENGTGYVTADEAYAAFLSALEANNWTIYPVGRYLKIVEKRNAANNNVWTYLDPDSDVPNDERMVTKLIRLNYVGVDALQNPVKQLLSKDSQLVALPPDTMIITEVGLNLRRVERIIAALDQPGGGEELRIIQIEYAAAADIADKLLQVFEDRGAQGRSGSGAQPARRTTTARPAGATKEAEGPAGELGGDEAGGVSISRVIPDERTNKLIVVASAKAFERIDSLIKQLDIPTGDTGRVNVYYLENANAEDIASTLQALTQGGGSTAARPTGRRAGQQGAAPAGPQGAVSAELFSGEVKISADTATNSLVIVASSQDYKNLVRVIEKLDIPRRQVFVEAVIMEVNLRKVRDFGISTHAGYAVETDEGIAPVVVGSQHGSANSLNLASLLSMGGFLAGLQGPAVPQVAELGVNLPAFGLVMQAVTTDSDVNVLSTPHILTSDNEEAEITVGQNVPFQAGYTSSGISNLLSGTTGSSGLASSLLGFGGLSSLYAPIQRQNVELRLKIKPQINESDYIRMEVEEQTEEIADTDPTLGPTTAKRTAKTVIVARDQTTVVIGGMIQERTINSVSKTPVLGDIPVLGRLFRQSSTTKNKTNLLLFLTPYIIQDQSDFRRIFERKMKEREQFVAAFYGTADTYEVPIDYSRKAGPVALLSRAVRAESQKLEHGGEGAPGERAIRPRVDPGAAPAPGDETTPPAGSTPVNPEPAPGAAPAPRDGATPPAGSTPANPEPAPGAAPAVPAPETGAPETAPASPADESGNDGAGAAGEAGEGE